MQDKYAKNTGFTIVELLIVIVVIAILASISIVAYNGIQARARDSQRKSDLATIAKGLAIYNVDAGNLIEVGSGCGSNGNGQVWFNHNNGTGYPRAINECLNDAGIVKQTLKDPSGATSCSGTNTECYAYMKYHCGGSAYIYTNLESTPYSSSSTATDGTCAATLDTVYGMDYFVKVN